MRYEQEVVERVGSTGTPGLDEFAVVIVVPHGEHELMTIALDTPDERRHELHPAMAAALANHLAASLAVFEAAQAKVAFEEEED